MLVADGQRLFAEAIAGALISAGRFRVLEEFPSTTDQTLAYATRLRPEVLLLDYWMPGSIDAKTVVAQLSEHAPGTAVLMLSWAHGSDHVKAALDAGAAGFLPKSLSLDQLAQAIWRAHLGERPVFGDQLRRMVAALEDRTGGADEQWRRFMELSAREMEVLRLLTAGFTAQGLRDELKLASGTVRNYIYAVMKNLGVSSQQEAVQMARRNGFFPPDPEGPPSKTPRSRG